LQFQGDAPALGRDVRQRRNVGAPTIAPAFVRRFTAPAARTARAAHPGGYRLSVSERAGASVMVLAIATTAPGWRRSPTGAVAFCPARSRAPGAPGVDQRQTMLLPAMLGAVPMSSAAVVTSAPSW
jgi:hypothetical protein